MKVKINIKNLILIWILITVVIYSVIFIKKTKNYTKSERQAEISMQAITNRKVGTNIQEDENLKIQIEERSEGKNQEEGTPVFEGQGMAYTVYITNIGKETLNNLHIKAVNENAIYMDYVTREEKFTTIIDEVTYYEENPELNEKEFDISQKNPGETVRLDYQVVAKEVEGDDKQLTNVREISGDQIRKKTYQTAERNIMQSRIKVRLKADYPEYVTVLSNGSLDVSMFVKNISDEKIESLMVELPLPDYTFDDEQVVYIEGAKYFFESYENDVLKFEVEYLQPG